MSATEFRAQEVRAADVLVVGGGAAGLSAALHARGCDVILVTKSAFADGGSSVLAQGGIAAAVGRDDTPAHHARDTLKVGAELCDPEVVHRVTSEGPHRIGELLVRGARLDRRADGSLALGREAAHSRDRVAHADGDATGLEIVRALAAAVRDTADIVIDEGVLALDLVLDRGGVVGVFAVDREGRQILYVASEVVLATGGIGRLWRHTTNPGEATGDGLAMAIRAGARVADLEFVQFHPTALAVDDSPMPLLTEALRGEGALLTNDAGLRFMVDEHPDAELAPRDVVARAIWRRLRSGERVYLDATRLDIPVGERFPTVALLCREHGLELANERVPVVPAAHYHMGGVMVDPEGRTSIPGLWACGEVARSGLHGANRLASNSLLETLVYGSAVGEALISRTRASAHPVRVVEVASRTAPPVSSRPWLADATASVIQIEANIRNIMGERCGLERSASGLHRAAFDLAGLTDLVGQDRGELTNLLQVARMVVRAATARTESRGAHFRSDFPKSCGCWRQPVVFDGASMLEPHPVGAEIAVG
jgi:L-aspartate oxidase